MNTFDHIHSLWCWKFKVQSSQWNAAKQNWTKKAKRQTTHSTAMATALYVSSMILGYYRQYCAKSDTLDTCVRGFGNRVPISLAAPQNAPDRSPQILIHGEVSPSNWIITHCRHPQIYRYNLYDLHKLRRNIFFANR